MRKRTHWLEAVCTNCQIRFEYYPKTHLGKFCSNRCQGEFRRNNETKRKFDLGEPMDRVTQKRCVTERDGYSCAVCDISEWRGGPLSLTLDHADGDPSNDAPENLRLICPNCHSQTPSYGGRNKGRGRKSRGIPLR